MVCIEDIDLKGDYYMYKDRLRRRAGILRLLVIVLAVCLMVSFGACSNRINASDRVSRGIETYADEQIALPELHDAIKQMLGFDIDSGLIEEAEVSAEESIDTMGKVKILIKSGREDDVRKLLDKELGSGMGIDSSRIPLYQGNVYAEELKQMESIRYYVIFYSGERIKSIDINIYMAEDGADTYLYIFG